MKVAGALVSGWAYQPRTRVPVLNETVQGEPETFSRRQSSSLEGRNLTTSRVVFSSPQPRSALAMPVMPLSMRSTSVMRRNSGTETRCAT